MCIHLLFGLPGSVDPPPRMFKSAILIEAFVLSLQLSRALPTLCAGSSTRIPLLFIGGFGLVLGILCWFRASSLSYRGLRFGLGIISCLRVSTKRERRRTVNCMIDGYLLRFRRTLLPMASPRTTGSTFSWEFCRCGLVRSQKRLLTTQGEARAAGRWFPG